MSSEPIFRPCVTGFVAALLLALTTSLAKAQPIPAPAPEEPPGAGEDEPQADDDEGEDTSEDEGTDDEADGAEDSTETQDTQAGADKAATEQSADNHEGDTGTPGAPPASLTSSEAAEDHAAEANDDEAPSAERESTTWYDVIDLSAFVDGYAAYNWAQVKPQTSSTVLRSFDRDAGFALSWVGLDLSVPTEPVGAHLSLRFGPSARIHGSSCLSDDTAVAPCDGDVGLAFVRQAYASWRPGARWTVDAGKFDPFVGAEVSESQGNMNYTRGLLFGFAQPLFHTGVRVEYEVAPWLTARGLVANGYNNSVDNNLGKTVGVQGEANLGDSLTVKLGWLGGPEQSDVTTIACPANTVYDPSFGGCGPATGATAAATYPVDRGGADLWWYWRHLIDLVVDYQATDALRLLANADLGTEEIRFERFGGRTPDSSRATWYGAALGARYQLPSNWAVAGRAEYFADPQGRATLVRGAKLSTWTGTLEYLPFDALMLRLEQRIDVCHDASGSRRIFPDGLRDASPHQMTTTLGLVAQLP